jgi:DNA-binding MarR family transcriptional regulator
MAASDVSSCTAAGAWSRIGELLELERCRTTGVARDLGLSSSQLLALRALDPQEPQPMGRLAGVLECDKGNVTGIVDRLERRGLVERRAVEHDRRVKVLALTAEGVRLREAVEARLATPPAALEAVAADELQALDDALAGVVAELRDARGPACSG